MMARTHQYLSLLLGTVALSVMATVAQGQSYPAKPIRMIIPFSAGGATDVPGRIVAQRLSEVFRHQVFVDNRPGAGSTIGAGLAAKAPPDGYTLLLTATTHVISANLYQTLPYHAVNDFTPVMQIGVAPSVLVAHPSLPAKSVKELIALAKARPGQIDFASSGMGTAQHMFCELFQLLAGIQMNHIPYQGGAPVTDVISGRVQVWVPGMALALPLIKAGRLRPLGTTGSQRSRGMPDVPTIAEAGVAGYDAALWHGVLAPKATPGDIVGRLHAEMTRVLKLPEVESGFFAAGNDVVATNPEQFGAYLKSEFEKWGKVVRASGAKVN